MSDIAETVRPPRRRSEWTVTRVNEPARPASPRPRTLLDRLLLRREPTTFQRCLAVHMHYAAPHKTLS